MKKFQLALCILGLSLCFSFDCNTRMTKSELLLKAGVYAVMPADFEYDFKFKVISYDWIYKGRNDVYEGSAKGSPYPLELISRIKEGNTKDVLFIENVKVIGDDKLVRKISGLTIILK